jgi:hypothetical protein
MNFIGKHITDNISEFTKKTIKDDGGYFLELSEPIMVGNKSNWEVIGINQLGHPSMAYGVSINFSLFTDKQIIKLKKQIDNKKYKIYKYLR